MSSDKENYKELLVASEDNINDTVSSVIVCDIDKLHRKSRNTFRKEVELRNIEKRLKDALFKGWCPGYGLAAIQIGVPIRAGVYWIPGKNNTPIWNLLINPIIVEKRDLYILPGEGCLSIPNELCSVRRYDYIKYLNEGKEFEAKGKEAQIIQHEIDHMDGVLIIDKEYRSNLIGRNDLCPCGSGKKHKKCCLY